MLCYKFPAAKGLQAGCEYYVCMIPLGIISKIFLSNSEEVSPEFRAQRKLNHSRIPDIKNYILNNRDSYVFSALAASVDGQVNFIKSPMDDNVGILEIDMDSTFLINDGQHRKAAIEAAILEDESLKNETISVVLFRDKGLGRSQQMFADLNKHAVTTSKSINVLYESKDPTDIATKKLVKEVDFLRKYTHTENDNLGKFSSKIFTLNNIRNANQKIIRNREVDDKTYDFLLNFWSLVCKNIKEWQEMDSGLLYKKDLREDYILTQGVTLLALGKLGAFLLDNQHLDMEKSLKNLSKIDWLRSSQENWLGRAIKPNGNINRNEEGITLTYIKIKQLIGLDLTTDEKAKEAKFNEVR